ncbi:hypothetical protein B0H34DRAFT_216102 [Crassisporium funariophilum]|nr:hypothetical protein B0H34DRAFT_216102 [Crassisporium funariophilum]
MKTLTSTTSSWPVAASSMCRVLWTFSLEICFVMIMWGCPVQHMAWRYPVGGKTWRLTLDPRFNAAVVNKARFTEIFAVIFMFVRMKNQVQPY